MTKPKTEESTDLSGRLRAKLRLERGTQFDPNAATVYLDVTIDDQMQRSDCLAYSSIEFAEAIFYGTWTDEDE